MASLKSIADYLDSLDTITVNNRAQHVLKGMSYDLTFNESLGLGDGKPFHVSQPYAQWPKNLKDAPTSFESPLAIGFKDVLKAGLTASKKDGQVFIDIASLAGGWPTYFHGTHEDADTRKEDLATAVGRMIKALPDSATPVIRVLLGMRGKTEGSWQQQLQDEFRSIFWPNDQCILHKNAQVHVGFYSPSFDAT